MYQERGRKLYNLSPVKGTVDLTRMQVPFVCPLCRGALVRESEVYCCLTCQRQFPTVMGIHDFRVFPDPYISYEEENRKVQKLIEHYRKQSFSELLALYWEMTPGVPETLVKEYMRMALVRPQQSEQTWHEMNSVAGLSKVERLLEVGCSTGGFLAAVGPKLAQAVGIDIALRWLIIGQKRLEELGVDNVTLVCACAEHLPFPEGIFDVVVAEDVLDHVRDQKAFVSESARVLRDQTGLFYLTTPNRYSLSPDPHVWLWGVGFIPPRLRDAYVRWRRGISYGPIRPVSYPQVRRLLRCPGLRDFHIMLPRIRVTDYQRLSLWQRMQVRVYELVRSLPVVSHALRWIGPSFHVFCTKGT